MDNNTFIAGLARQTGRNISQTENLANCLTKVIGDIAAGLDSVAIPGFGRFDSEKHDEYISVDPSTGRNMLYPPEIKISFTAGSMLKKRFSHE